MKFDFSVSTAKIIAEVRNRTCIDKIEAEVLEDILNDALIKYHNEVFTYGHSIGYDDGYVAGDDAGYDAGYTDGRAYGYTEGHSDGFSAGYSEGHSEVKTLIKMR